MPKKEIDLEGIDFSDLGVGKKPKVPGYRTHTWTDRVALEKKLKRWKSLRERELERLSVIDAAIQDLEQELRNFE